MPVTIANVINFLNPSAPKGLIDDARRWVDQRKLKDDIRAPSPAAWYRGFGDHGEAIFHDPILDAAGNFPELPNVRWAVSHESTLFYLKEARVLGAEGAIVSADNKVFREFNYPPSAGWLAHSCFRRRRIPPVTTLRGWYATITYPSSRAFFHWMLESLPRMKLLRDYVGILDGLIVPESPLPFHKESLAILGVPPEKLIPVGPNSHFQVEHLFVPKYCSFLAPPAWLHEWYKSTFVRPAGNVAEPCRRIFLSRSDGTFRKVRNEDEMVAHLEPLGFKSFTLANMPFEAQARLFFDADVIVAPHGAALANLVFCRPGTRVLEIFSPRWMPPCFFALAKSAQLSYSYMVADAVPNSPSDNPQAVDVIADIVRFKRHVDELLAEDA